MIQTIGTSLKNRRCFKRYHSWYLYCWFTNVLNVIMTQYTLNIYKLPITKIMIMIYTVNLPSDELGNCFSIYHIHIALWLVNNISLLYYKAPEFWLGNRFQNRKDLEDDMDNLVYSPVFAAQEQTLLQCCCSSSTGSWQWVRAASTSAETANTKFTGEPLRNFDTVSALNSFPISLGSWLGLISMKKRWSFYSWSILTYIKDENHMKKCAPRVKYNTGQRTSNESSPWLLYKSFPKQTQVWPLWWKGCLLPQKAAFIEIILYWGFKEKNINKDYPLKFPWWWDFKSPGLHRQLSNHTSPDSQKRPRALSRCQHGVSGAGPQPAQPSAEPLLWVEKRK